jgi:hypothetical protein
MGAAMFNEISERLVAWAGQVVGEPIATLGPPTTGTSDRRIGLSLVDVIPQAAARAQLSRFEVSLRYLATVSAETPAEAHRLLGLLTFAAMSRPDLTLDPDRPSMQFWLAFGMAPQPCLSLRVTAWKDHEIHDPDVGEPRVIERRRVPADPPPKHRCAFQRRATDWPTVTLSNKPETRTQLSPWRNRC